jgi:hypothetical protein
MPGDRWARTVASPAVPMMAAIAIRIFILIGSWGRKKYP